MVYIYYNWRTETTNHQGFKCFQNKNVTMQLIKLQLTDPVS